MSATGSRTFRRHMAELDSGTYSKGSILALRKAMREHSRKERGYSTSKTYMGMSPQELADIIARIKTQCPLILPDQEAQGLMWLRDRVRFKKLPDHAQAVLSDDNFRNFQLVDFYDAGDYLADPLPVYRVNGRDGHFFDYVSCAWQGGERVPGRLIVIG